MRTENNGKLAIAIVAMLVVALSIVGVTYAYFTAQVSGNTATTSGQISAGILSINYSGSQTLNVQNVVPDWETDGTHYYDPVASRYNVGNGKVGIKAISTTECGTTYTNCSIDEPTAANGIANPVTFTVTNTHENGRTAYYAIKLVGIENPTTADTEDQDKIVYTLSNGTDTYTGDLAVTGSEQYIVPAEIAIKNQHNDGTVTEADYTDTWTLNLRYPNIESDQTTPAAGGDYLKATVKVVGISQGTDGWYEEYSSTKIVFAANN